MRVLKHNIAQSVKSAPLNNTLLSSPSVSFYYHCLLSWFAKRERNGDGLLLALIMDAVTDNLAAKLSVFWSPRYLKDLTQLQCLHYDGKIVMKGAMNVFDVEGDVTYSVDRLRMRFETNFSTIRP